MTDKTDWMLLNPVEFKTRADSPQLKRVTHTDKQTDADRKTVMLLLEKIWLNKA